MQNAKYRQVKVRCESCDRSYDQAIDLNNYRAVIKTTKTHLAPPLFRTPIKQWISEQKPAIVLLRTFDTFFVCWFGALFFKGKSFPC
jgi:hypothetical protein